MSSKKDSTPISKRPIICVNIEYYEAPDEALLEELYKCVLEEFESLKGISAISLYEQFDYNNLMLVVFCDSAGDATNIVRSDAFRKVKGMFTTREFGFVCSLLDYIKGDPVGIGD